MGIVHGKLVEGDRVVVPADFLQALGLKEGDGVILELDGDELRVRSAHAALRRIQEWLRPYAREGVSIVDELIAERRAEAERE